MGVILKKNKDGSGIRPMWYIRFQNGGKTTEKNTGIPIRGNPPASLSLRENGDGAFERSRTQAELYFADFQRQRKIKGASEELTRELIREKTGREIEDVPLSELFSRWSRFSRVRPVSEVRVQCTRSAFARFTAFLSKSRDAATRACRFTYDVTPEMARAYIDSLKGDLAVTTVRDHLSLLAGTFRRLLPNGVGNPFADIRVGTGSADDAKIHRKPLSDRELEKLYAQAKESEDAFIYPITVCAANTGLRIGDVCKLKWEDVYLDEGHISLVTSKTGAAVNIPIFPELQKVLESCLAEKEDGEPFVFPDAASCYTHNRSGLFHRGKMLFAQALYGDLMPQEEATEVVNGKPKPPMTEAEVLEAIDGCRKFFPFKKAKAKDVYLRYTHGESYTDIEKAIGMPRPRISAYLKDIEDLTGERIRPGLGKDITRMRLAKTRQAHKNGKNAVSVYGWHSLRATFCVKALFKGIPEQLIIAVVGHKTFETTKNYLHPTWEVFKEAWERNSLPPHPLLATCATTVPAKSPAVPTMTRQTALSYLHNTLTPEQISAFMALGIPLKAS